MIDTTIIMNYVKIIISTIINININIIIIILIIINTSIMIYHMKFMELEKLVLTVPGSAAQRAITNSANL